MLIFKHLNILESDANRIGNDTDSISSTDKYNKKISNLNKTQSEDAKYLRPDGTLVDMALLVATLEAVNQDIAAHFPAVYEVLYHKDILFTDNPQIRTMATDGISIFINPIFMENMLNECGAGCVEFIIIHECFHILFDHCKQHELNDTKYEDGYKVNEAQDYEINYVIENFLFQGTETPFKGMTEQSGGLINDDYGKDGLTWEEIYPKVESKRFKINKANTSKSWKNGFIDGYNEILADLRKQNLVEKLCVTM